MMILILATLMLHSTETPSTVLTDAQAGYNQAAYDAEMDQ